MAFATAQISAPGLAQDQLEAEQVWLKQFNQDGDSLDWSRWGKWWASGQCTGNGNRPGNLTEGYERVFAWRAGTYLTWLDAFLQFGNEPRIEGKGAIIKYLEPQMNVLESMHHEIIRLSFDEPLGLIYQTVIITYKVKGDLQGRAVQIPGLGVLHKRVGENLLMGFEVYIDKAPLQAVVKEVSEGNQKKE